MVKDQFSQELIFKIDQNIKNKQLLETKAYQILSRLISCFNSTEDEM